MPGVTRAVISAVLVRPDIREHELFLDVTFTIMYASGATENWPMVTLEFGRLPRSDVLDVGGQLRATMSDFIADLVEARIDGVPPPAGTLPRVRFVAGGNGPFDRIRIDGTSIDAYDPAT